MAQPTNNILSGCNGPFQYRKNVKPVHDPVVMKTYDPIFLESPSVLFSDSNWRLFFPDKSMNQSEVFNALTRFSIYLFVILSLLNNSLTYLLIPVFVVLLSLFVHIFGDSVERMGPGPQYFYPTKANPMMNPNLANDADFDKKRPDMDSPEVQSEIKKKFYSGLFRDVDDLWEKNNSERQFYSVPFDGFILNPHTTKFANWLYNKGQPTCKEDSTQCNRYMNCNDEHRRQSHIVQ